jgi:predicted ATPase
MKTRSNDRDGHSDATSLQPFLTSLPDDGRLFVLTGINGSGKSRALSSMAIDALHQIESENTEISRLICLSGAALDKYPNPKKSPNCYEYFGRKANTNLFSEIKPYRAILRYLASLDSNYKLRASTASEYLSSIGLEDEIVYRLRRAKGSSRLAEISAEELSIHVRLSDQSCLPVLQRTLQRLDSGLLHVSGVSLKKKDQLYDISDLSSGERAYSLAILCLAFASTDNCFIMYDEPENSLHPKWQISIISDLYNILDRVSPRFRLAIATHSPLIVASASNHDTYILDLEESNEWIRSRLHGNNADSVLRSQFRVVSPRSNLFILLMQQCLQEIAKGSASSDLFRTSAERLFSLDIVLKAEDPLYATYNQVRQVWEGLAI